MEFIPPIDFLHSLGAKHNKFLDLFFQPQRSYSKPSGQSLKTSADNLKVDVWEKINERFNIQIILRVCNINQYSPEEKWSSHTGSEINLQLITLIFKTKKKKETCCLTFNRMVLIQEILLEKILSGQLNKGNKLFKINSEHLST